MQALDCKLPFSKDVSCCDAITDEGVRCPNRGIIPLDASLFSERDSQNLGKYKDLASCRRAHKRPTNADRHRRSDGARYHKGRYYICGRHFGKVASGSAARFRKSWIAGAARDALCEQVVYAVTTSLMEQALLFVTRDPQALQDLRMIIEIEDAKSTVKSAAEAFNGLSSGFSPIDTDSLKNVWDTLNLDSARVVGQAAVHSAASVGKTMVDILSRLRSFRATPNGTES